MVNKPIKQISKNIKHKIGEFPIRAPEVLKWSMTHDEYSVGVQILFSCL